MTSYSEAQEYVFSIPSSHEADSFVEEDEQPELEVGKQNLNFNANLNFEDCPDFEPPIDQELFSYNSEEPTVIQCELSGDLKNSTKETDPDSCSKIPEVSSEDEKDLLEETQKSTQSNEESSSLTNSPSSNINESQHLFREDVIMKATIRAANKIIKTFIDENLKQFYKEHRVTLKRKLDTHRIETYYFIVECVTKALGYQLPERRMKGVYAIIFHLCLRKRDAIEWMIPFSSESEKRSVALELQNYNKQSLSYTKDAGEFCLNHCLLKVAKALYFTNPSSQAVFRDHVLNTNKMVGIKDPEQYLARLVDELKQIEEDF
ncbi:unnamed protein product [Moneuplotes crassus]|uniref:Uncharacterized protein n=1 Tax=Euplotes crassus TaxID=5936 RepID=A0AAD1XMW4_EUPCR|nr:unnamed protein product [Moneuplotes crassus]